MEEHKLSSPIRQDAPGQAVKGDAGKPDLSLLSPIWIFAVAEVLTYGEKKRGRWNWRKGMALSRMLAAALRHIFQFLNGEDYDFDPNCEDCKKGDCLKHSGKCHLDNAACMLMFARELWETRPDLDDRYKPEVKK